MWFTFWFFVSLLANCMIWCIVLVRFLSYLYAGKPWFIPIEVHFAIDKGRILEMYPWGVLACICRKHVTTCSVRAVICVIWPVDVSVQRSFLPNCTFIGFSLAQAYRMLPLLNRWIIYMPLNGMIYGLPPKSLRWKWFIPGCPNRFQWEQTLSRDTQAEQQNFFHRTRETSL